MALKDTIKNMKHLLVNIIEDLEKADGGNKAASQRVRTGTVKLEKVAKLYRKESIQSEKTTKGRVKKAPKPAKAKASKAAAPKAKASKAPKAKATKAAAKPKAKKTAAKARQLSFKRPTAKLPTRRTGARS